jgi:hypothetical protein
MLQATIYTITPKKIPSFVLFEDTTIWYDPTFSIDAGTKIVIIPNTYKTSLSDAKWLSQNGAGWYYTRSVNSKYIMLIKRCGSWAGKAVACVATKDLIEKTAKLR